MAFAWKRVSENLEPRLPCFPKPGFVLEEPRSNKPRDHTNYDQEDQIVFGLHDGLQLELTIPQSKRRRSIRLNSLLDADAGGR